MDAEALSGVPMAQFEAEARDRRTVSVPSSRASPMPVTVTTPDVEPAGRVRFSAAV